MKAQALVDSIVEMTANANIEPWKMFVDRSVASGAREVGLY